MVVCICRSISDRDFQDPQELQQRLQESDVQCGCCLTESEDGPLKSHTETNFDIKEK